ncbi:thiamine ABC transporter substrate binding subunit [Streptomyces polyrhachis]|uniref:Thiamine ABC transporter substrate binding subunit n=1 Tax=Streptomyces polyrhachis TaxID=1282885 RepID=A0ABW2GHG6_9ACTN
MQFPIGGRTARRTAVTALAVALGAGSLAACGDDGGSTDGAGKPKTVTLVTHDSFAVSKNVLKEFEKQSGYQVKVLKGSDAGSAVNQAVLSKGNPQGDVFFGIDNTLLSRGLKNGIFTPYEAKDLAAIPERLQLDKGEHRVTPVDFGDICVNYDRAYFAKKKLDPPATFADLVKPQYKNLLVTENAATSSPGLGFLLASAAAYGEDGWQDYWKQLKANGVEVVDGWEQAYFDRFSGAGKGDRPLVVSYASSPPAGVLDVKPQPKEAPTGVSTGTCFRQIEFAGLLAGAKNEEGGKQLIDFMLGRTFQEDMPLNMFVYPAREDAALPELFTTYGTAIDKPLSLAPATIDRNREQWIKTWTSLVVR